MILIPPADLPDPNLQVLEAGATLHRIHRRSRASDAFNPCQGGPTRFAPIVDEAGNCVPSLYAGSTFDAATYETLFHDIPVQRKRKILREFTVLASVHGVLETQRALHLAALRGPDLAKWNLSRNSLIGSSARLYRQTAAWAKAIHDQFREVEGLVWTSNRCDPDDAFLFFGDRMTGADFRIASVRDASSEPSFLADVRRAGQRAGIRIAT